MTAANGPFQRLIASVPMFECCNCTTRNGQGMIVARPLYAAVWQCRCGHTMCEQDTVEGMCPGCWYEPPEVRGFAGPWAGNAE